MPGIVTILVPLVEQHHSTLFRIVSGRVGETDASDVLQEVALAVEKGTPPENPKEVIYWLCRIALNQCALHFRRKVAEDTFQNEFANANSTLSQQFDDPATFLLARESRKQVQTALSRLDEASRELLIQKYLEEKTYQQLAEQLNITPHAAEYRVQVAKRKLKIELLELGEDAS